MCPGTNLQISHAEGLLTLAALCAAGNAAWGYTTSTLSSFMPKAGDEAVQKIAQEKLVQQELPTVNSGEKVASNLTESSDLYEDLQSTWNSFIQAISSGKEAVTGHLDAAAEYTLGSPMWTATKLGWNVVPTSTKIVSALALGAGGWGLYRWFRGRATNVAVNNKFDIHVHITQPTTSTAAAVPQISVVSNGKEQVETQATVDKTLVSMVEIKQEPTVAKSKVDADITEQADEAKPENDEILTEIEATPTQSAINNVTVHSTVQTVDAK